MSVLKTMKGQAVEAHASGIADDWPNGGVIEVAFFFDDDSGAALGSPNVANIREVVSGVQNSTGSCLVTNLAAGQNSVQIVVADATFDTDSMNLGTDSFILMYVGDVGTGTVLRLGTILTEFIAISASATGALEIKGTSGTILTLLGSLTQSQNDQLIWAAVDRINNEASVYEGTNGDSLVATKALINTDSPINCAGILSQGTISETDGIVLLRFPKGIPSNAQAMVQEIATELRKGTNDGVNYEPPVRRIWMNSLLDKYL